MADLSGFGRKVSDLLLQARMAGAKMTYSGCTHFRCTLPYPFDRRGLLVNTHQGIWWSVCLGSIPGTDLGASPRDIWDVPTRFLCGLARMSVGRTGHFPGKTRHVHKMVADYCGGVPPSCVTMFIGFSPPNLLGKEIVYKNTGNHENHGNHKMTFLKPPPFTIRQIPAFLGNRENHEMLFSKTTPAPLIETTPFRHFDSFATFRVANRNKLPLQAKTPPTIQNAAFTGTFSKVLGNFWRAPVCFLVT